MATKFCDRVRVSSATSGTGSLSLGSAISGYRSFDQAVTDGHLLSGSTVYYCIEDANGAWETGTGTFTSGTPSTLTRTVAASSNSGAAISLSGTSQVFITLTAGSEVTSFKTSGTISGCALDATNTGTTASQNDNSTKLATTAYVVGQASATNPVMNGSVAVGTSLTYARADHVHASDTSRLAVASNLSDVNSANTARNNLDQGATALTDGATISTDASTGNVFTVTLGGNRTLANPTNTKSGGHYIFVITQDATGSRTLSYGTNFKFANSAAPTLSTAAGAVDIISAVCVGTTLYCVMSNAFG